jgi:magnesium-transporting ATPase (P-type)
VQDKVPETIHFFRKAGVQIWMLTGFKLFNYLIKGDKRETAIGKKNLITQVIGKTTKLIGEKTKVSIIDGDNIETIQKKLEDTILLLKNERVCVVYDTDSLKFALKELKKLFIQVATSCESAICARVHLINYR